jgi:hypothetical protein
LKTFVPAFVLCALVACSSSNESRDAGAEDATTIADARDSLTRDADPPDVDIGDAEVADVESIDADSIDADSIDAENADAENADAENADAENADAEATDSGAPCVPATTGAITSTAVPALLSETGLYADILAKTVTPGVREFRPRYVLWSDGADKQRWVFLPDCTQIDTSNMDHWSLPVGTKLFKEFSRNGVRLETRMIVRTGPGANDFRFAAYAWNDQETEATRTDMGAFNVRNTTHDIPSVPSCRTCHTHLPERALGFSAVQLSHTLGGVTIDTLSNEGRLTVPYPGGFTTPGNTLEADALGYLHANCGNCHNESTAAIQFITPFSLRLSVDDVAVADTGTYRTAIDVPSEMYTYPGVVTRIKSQDPNASCVLFRMSQRGGIDQMPPVATEIVDPNGIDLISDWINTLP